jgi:hypothetical protein
MEDTTKPITNEFIDKVTLELLMNKNHYSRYLSQTDPKKHKEHLDYLEKIRKYRSKISNTTNDLLNIQDYQITTEVNEAYDNYIRTLIRHFECKEMENSEELNQDEDMLFGNINESIEKEEPTVKSYWGKHKVQKKSSNFGFHINYVPRIKSDNIEELA